MTSVLDRLTYLEGELVETQSDLRRAGPQLFWGMMFFAAAITVLGTDWLAGNGEIDRPAAVATGILATLGLALFALGQRQADFAGERADWINDEVEKA